MGVIGRREYTAYCPSLFYRVLSLTPRPSPLLSPPFFPTRSPLNSERRPVHLEFKVKIRLGSGNGYDSSTNCLNGMYPWLLSGVPSRSVPGLRGTPQVGEEEAQGEGSRGRTCKSSWTTRGSFSHDASSLSSPAFLTACPFLLQTPLVYE